MVAPKTINQCVHGDGQCRAAPAYCRVQSFAFSVWGSGFRVWCLVLRGLCVGWGVRRMQTNLGVSDHAGDGSFEIRHLARLDHLPGTHPPQSSPPSSRIQREETATRGALLDGCAGAGRELPLYPPVCLYSGRGQRADVLVCALAFRTGERE